MYVEVILDKKKDLKKYKFMIRSKIIGKKLILNFIEEYKQESFFQQSLTKF
jgi:hypothetical protein